jgi:hypothetical protein
VPRKSKGGQGYYKPRRCVVCSEQYDPSAGGQKYCKPCAARKIKYDWWQLEGPKRAAKLSHGAKSRAKSKGLLFNLTPEYIIDLWEINDGRCCLTGRKFDLTPYPSKHHSNPNAPSLDRIIPELGYVKGNVRLICYHMNVALSAYGEEAFKNLVEDYLQFNGAA